MHHPTDRIIHTTAFVPPVVEHWLEREIAQWVHPMKDPSDDQSRHERTLLPRSYISLDTGYINIGFTEQSDNSHPTPVVTARCGNMYRQVLIQTCVDSDSAHHQLRILIDEDYEDVIQLVLQRTGRLPSFLLRPRSPSK